MSDTSLILGAVSYSPKVVTIWEGMKDYFQTSGLPLDVVLFSNYERQVEHLLSGKIDIAWNTPLAHVRVKRLTQGSSISLGMRDTDRDFCSRLIVRNESGIKSPKDLHGKRLGAGSRDSTQARILPLYFLEEMGVDLGQTRLVVWDTDVGKHGDTGSSELEVLKALENGEIDAGVVGDLIWLTELGAGRVRSETLESIWTSPPYDHCMFDALSTISLPHVQRFQLALFKMDWNDPQHRLLLELEGLKRWIEPRESGYASLEKAIARLGVLK